jgi:hypothetical protein
MTLKPALACLALLVLVLGAVVPSASAQAPLGIVNPYKPTPTTLYFHVLDGLQDMPINTQKPDDSFAKDPSVGLETHSLSCLSQSPGDPLSDKEFHQWFAYSSPGYVQYNVTQNNLPIVHSERGLSYDIDLDGDGATLYWYLSSQTGMTPKTLPASPDPFVPIPKVTVHAWMRSGEQISIGNAGYKAGTLLAEGQVEGTLSNVPGLTSASGGDGTVRYIAAKDAQGHDLSVYEFALKMKYATHQIKKEGGYNMEVAAYIDNPYCTQPQDKTLMPNFVALHTDPENRPRLTLSVMNPIRIEYLHPQFIGDDLVIHTSSNSPWGNYDVDEVPTPGTQGMKGGMEVSIAGPSEARSAYRAAIVQRYTGHDHHTEAVDASYVWPFKADAAKDGLYTVTFAVKNDQGTATAVGTATFQVGDGQGGEVSICNAAAPGAAAKLGTCTPTTEGNVGGGPTGKKTPAVELLGLLGVLGVAAVAVRRRLA